MRNCHFAKLGLKYGDSSNMGQPLSIENEEWVSLITTRTACSRLWFINNPELENQILGCLARYQNIYEVILYGFVIMGNHYHLLARFPKCNRALFMRDFNSAVARLVGRNVNEHGRRSVWARRYAHQVLPREEDILHWFLYVALNPVSSGIVRDIHEYDSYNSFFDAKNGIRRKYMWYNWSQYLMSKRCNSDAKLEDFGTEYTLTFSRIPGYHGLPHNRYEANLNRLALARQDEIVKDRLSIGKGFLGAERRRQQRPGTVPRYTKLSSRNSPRPLVLTLCKAARRRFLDLYFLIRDRFDQVSALFRAGRLTQVFPKGTYPPPRLVPA